MKQIITLLLLLICVVSFSQLAPPQAFNYSAVARNAQNQPIANQTVGVQLSILKTSTVGTIQYQENHFTTTDQFGLFNLTVGTGAIQQGSFANINWGNDSYYLRVGLDAQGGNNFQLMGTTQLLSVPYALYAGNVVNNNDKDTSATNELQTLTISGDSLKISLGNSVLLPKKVDNDTSSTNELQTLSVSNDTVFLSNGGFVKIPKSEKLTVKINGTPITDPSIDDVMIDRFNFITEKNYRYSFLYPGDDRYYFPTSLTDSLSIVSTTVGTPTSNSFYMYVTSSNCSGSTYVPSTKTTSGGNGIDRGKVFAHKGNIYYVPINAPVVSLTNPYLITGSCGVDTGTFDFYQVFPNNPAITGFGFTSSRLKVTFER